MIDVFSIKTLSLDFLLLSAKGVAPDTVLNDSKSRGREVPGGTLGWSVESRWKPILGTLAACLTSLCHLPLYTRNTVAWPWLASLKGTSIFIRTPGSFRRTHPQKQHSRKQSPVPSQCLLSGVPQAGRLPSAACIQRGSMKSFWGSGGADAWQVLRTVPGA